MIVSAVLILALAILSQAGLAQSLTGLVSGAKSSASDAAANDPLKRTTPQSSIFNFLEACHSNNFLLASQYLDLRRINSGERSRQGPELARQLAAILDRDPKFEVQHLSNSPEGNLGDDLSPDLDELDSFRLNSQTVVLQMQREHEQGAALWLVSADSVARIPQLSALERESPIEKRLPQSLVTTQFIDTPLWIWIALFLLAIVLSVVSRLLSRIVIALLTPLVKHYAKTLQSYRLEAFVEPLRLLVSIAVFRACMEAIPPSALVRDYLLRLLAFLFILGAASFLMRVVDIVSDRAASRLDPRQRALSYSVFPLFVKIVKIFIFCIAILFVLSRWGYSTTTILAGLGVGGIAVALAAQKTIENLFGSVSLITDRPVIVGDFCQFGGQTGTVEDIGLRSTRIRTLDRTVVTIPNSVFSTMTLENFSRRDRMWFHPTLHLRRDTTPEQIQDMMDEVTEILKGIRRSIRRAFPLRFTKITNESFDLDTLRVRAHARLQRISRSAVRAAAENCRSGIRLKIGFAVPFQESITMPHGRASRQSGSLPVRSQDIEVDVQPLPELVERNVFAVAVHGRERSGVDDHRDHSVGRDAAHSKLLAIGAKGNHDRHHSRVRVLFLNRGSNRGVERRIGAAWLRVVRLR